MSWLFLFRRGFSYIAGFDRPRVVALDTIAEKVEEEGFRVLGIWPCEEIAGFGFDPPGTCGEEWDFFGFVERTGKTGVVDVPDRVQWIREIPKPLPKETKPNGVKPPPPAVEPCTVVRVVEPGAGSAGGHGTVAVGAGLGLAAGIGVALLTGRLGVVVLGVTGTAAGTIAGALYARARA